MSDKGKLLELAKVKVCTPASSPSKPLISSVDTRDYKRSNMQYRKAVLATEWISSVYLCRTQKAHISVLVRLPCTRSILSISKSKSTESGQHRIYAEWAKSCDPRIDAVAICERRASNYYQNCPIFRHPTLARSRIKCGRHKCESAWLLHLENPTNATETSRYGRHDSGRILRFVDRCALPSHPGWPLRNYLALLSMLPGNMVDICQPLKLFSFREHGMQCCENDSNLDTLNFVDFSHAHITTNE